MVGSVYVLNLMIGQVADGGCSGMLVLVYGFEMFWGLVGGGLMTVIGLYVAACVCIR